MTNSNSFEDSYRHKGLRKKLVAEITSKGIKNQQVLDAILKIPRHFFLDSAFDEIAYQDQALQIGEGQTISQPYTVAYQSELLEVSEDEKVLEIGLGSGYQACVLIELGAKVYSIERIAKLYEKAKWLLPKMGYQPEMILGDGTLGAPEFAPFDKILITAAAPEMPKILLEQLKIGGKMVIPLGDRKSQTMVRVTRLSKNDYQSEKFELFRFVPLIGKDGWKS